MKQMEPENAKLKIMKQKKKRKKKELHGRSHANVVLWLLFLEPFIFCGTHYETQEKGMDKIYETVVGMYLTARKMIFLLLEIH